MPPVVPTVTNPRPRIPSIYSGRNYTQQNYVQQQLSKGQDKTKLTGADAIQQQLANKPTGQDDYGVRDVNKLKPAELPTDLFSSSKSNEDPFTSFYRQLSTIGDSIDETRAAHDAAYNYQKTLKELQQQANDNYQNSQQPQLPGLGNFDTGTATGKRKNLINNLMKYIGLPYSWGGGGSKGPSYGIGRGSGTYGFDCSGLVQYAFASVGLKIPRFSGDQLNWGKARGYMAPINKLQAGDLVGRYGGGGGGHIAIYLGNGRILEAPYTGARVRIRKLSASDMKRYVGIHVRY